MIVNNTFYYMISKETLEEKVVDNMVTEARQIHVSLLRTKEGERFVERLVGERLRSDGIAIQAHLDPDVEQVSNEQLDELAAKLNLKAITLLKKTDDNITLYKSSYRDEIGLSTKSWGLWYQAFQELFASNNVSKLQWGQSLPNFWSGPYSVSDTNVKEVNKYGYYYDGSTNYLINPFINDQTFRDYDKEVGIQAIIQDTKRTNPTILEISGINATTFGQAQMEVTNERGQTWTPRYYIPIFFGSYDYVNVDPDRQHIRKALDTKKPSSYDAIVNGKHVFKTFIPVFTESNLDELGTVENADAARTLQTINYYVIGITSDYEFIQSELNHTLLQLSLLILLVTIFCVGIMVLLNYLFTKSKDQAVSATQATYIEEMNNLFRSIRGQRHDFLNHVSTIHALLELGDIRELKRYTEEMIGDVKKIEDIIEIGQPAVAALVQTKIVLAESQNIRFTHEFHDLSRFPSGVKSVDVVRIIGNLVDNAFDEVIKLPQEERRVELRGWIEDRMLRITVSNPGYLSEEQIGRIFEPGYSSKSRSDHSGLGLSITKDILHKYKGRIHVESAEGVKFQVAIPLQASVHKAS
ncbi:GHKL domain-containing protein [Paenibacillus athensensis]|uniref:Histidine kinase domain-containing protein n=1 Tax=Paenibacillus athensensis TaxID=1967502 RepID=A0A4Y8Q9Z8_9BACL|nr:ATP-binding protein [Paenibacillus athensensis]MCD1260077.1 GHKL domain-containing protein [Paenibacillus athensensis]